MAFEPTKMEEEGEYLQVNAIFEWFTKHTYMHIENIQNYRQNY